MGRNFIARPALFLCVTIISVNALAACGSNSPPPSRPSYSPSPPSLSLPPPSPTNSSLTAATDCSQPNTDVPTSSAFPPDTYSAKTDSTRTSLLIQNTGPLTLFVTAEENTVLQPTPDINPTDPADNLALKALVGSDVFQPYYSAGYTAPGVYVLPPGYGVCGTVPYIYQIAKVTIWRDRDASAAWFATHSLTQALYGRLESIKLNNDKTVQAMVTCANGTVSVASSNPDWSDADLYANVMQ